MAATSPQEVVPNGHAPAVSSRRRPGWLGWVCRCVLGAAACGAVGVAGATAYFGSPFDALAFARGESIVVRPSMVLLAPAAPGEPRVGKCAVRNLSGRTVRLIGSDACCGCRVTSGVPSAVGPGGTTWLEFAVYAGNGGEEVRVVSVYTDDGIVPEFRVQLRAAGPR